MPKVEFLTIHYVWIHISLHGGAETRKLLNSCKVNELFVQKPFYCFVTVWIQEM